MIWKCERCNELEGLLHQAEVREEQLEAAGADLEKVLRQTIYRPPGFSGPAVWWRDRAETALNSWSLLASHIGETTT